MKILDLHISDIVEARIKLGWLNHKVIMFPTKNVMYLMSDPNEWDDIDGLDLGPHGISGVSEYIKQRCMMKEKEMAHLFLKAAGEQPDRKENHEMMELLKARRYKLN